MALAYGDGVPVFCADAIADPLAGTHAALAALACWWRGESAVVDLAHEETFALFGAFAIGDVKHDADGAAGAADVKDAPVGREPTLLARVRAADTIFDNVRLVRRNQSGAGGLH